MSNRSAIGAKVRVKATIKGKTFWQLREINTGDGWAGNPLEAHFGLGNATNVETVRIEWPSGTVQESSNVNPNQILNVIEPPRLSINAAGTLSWPARAEGYVLYQSARPEGPWEQMGAPVVTTNRQATVEVSLGNSARFFRLQLP